MLQHPLLTELLERYRATLPQCLPWVLASLFAAFVFLLPFVLLRVPAARRLLHATLESRVIGRLSWALTLGAAAFGVIRAWTLMWVADDAFISFRYAENLVRGHGLVFNPGERVEGYTNFLWTLLVAAPMAVGVGPITTSIVLSLLCFAGVIVLSTRLSARINPESRFGMPLAALLIACSYTMGSFGTSGLETMFGAFMVLLAMDCAARRRPLSAAAAGIAATMAHPDHAVFYASLGAVLLTYRERRREIFRYVLPLALVYVPYYIWRWHYYGELFPNTYYAKSAELLYFSQGRVYWAVTVFSAGLLAVVPLAVEGAVLRWHLPEARQLLIGGTLYAVYVAKIGGDFMLGRLAVVLLPLLVVFAESAVRWLLTRCNLAVNALGALALLSILPVMWPTTVVRAGEKYWHVADERTFYAMRALSEDGIVSPAAQQARDLRRLVVERWGTPTVAAGSIGIFGYLSRVPIVDVFGLTDRTIAHQPIRRRGRPGHEKNSGGAYLFDRQVDLSTDPVFPAPYDQLTRLRLAGTQYFMTGFHTEFLEGLQDSREVRFTDVRRTIDRYYPERDRPTPERLACDLWFFDQYYFRHHDDRERQARLLQRVTEWEPSLANVSEVLLLRGGAPLPMRPRARLGFDAPERWETWGDSFVRFPTTSPVPDQQFVAGHIGPFANSMADRLLDGATGSSVSAPFMIVGDIMTLQIGGGMDPQGLTVSLLVDGQPVRSATGCMSEIMGRRVWDISEFKGKSASIRIEDRSADSYGHIMVDEIEQWDARSPERATAPISVLPEEDR
ncbi:hypothetical protein [Sorangium atrum]|uniref:Uncharacterized protein n=1 Tax=Sorangium atrum TaxID=2995308 RepID=A0ABT5BRB0_9BACT|nr:hypothetical protein [Sorangium aterium]MDC0676233.1 hypothetical protein [Sorangium aterium]